MNEPITTDASYRLLIQSITDYAIYMLSPDGTVTNWNAGAQRAKGYRADEVVGTHFSRFFTPEDQELDLPRKSLAKALAEGGATTEGWRVRKDGSRFWAHVTLTPMFGMQRELIGFSKVTRDRTELKQHIDELRLAKETLDLALSNMSEGLCLLDANGDVILFNPRFEQTLRLEPGTVVAGTSLRTSLRRQRSVDGEVLERGLGEHWERPSAPGEIVSTERQWSGRTISVNQRWLPDGGCVTTVQDVTDRKMAEQQIAHLAHHDALTQLPNRAAFRGRLDSLMRAGVSSALLYLDLDRFKPVNDTLGHAAGDTVLQTIARRIGPILRKGDVGARLGGDEFVVLLSGCDALKDAERVAARLSEAVKEPIFLGTTEITVGASIGIALAPLHGTDAETLLRCADLALYSAKESGRACVCVYDETMQSTVQHRRALERDLRLALERGELSLHYQPIVDIRHGMVRSFEALIRWESPTRGSLSPADFIPFAEEVGLMPEIGDWVIRTACRQAVTWESAVGVSVNLSPTQFRVPNLAQRVSAVLEECGLPAHRLELEITETAMIADIAGARAILTELRDRGIQIALDDFGTGYSSLSFLRSFPFTRIKIDRSFVQDLGKNPEATAIIRAVTGLCEGLGVAATAEGVETEKQMQILRGEGCVEVQGYFIQKPAGPSETAMWLASFQAHAEPEVELAS